MSLENSIPGVTVKKMFLEGDRPLLQSAIFGLFGLEGLPPPGDPNYNPINPYNMWPVLFNQVEYKNLDDIYFKSVEITQTPWAPDEKTEHPCTPECLYCRDNKCWVVEDAGYEVVNLIGNYLYGLRPNY